MCPDMLHLNIFWLQWLVFINSFPAQSCIHVCLFQLFFTQESLTSFKVDDYLRKSSLTGPEIFMVVFLHEKEEDSAKK